MGTHPKAPSTLVITGESLPEWLKRNPLAMGKKLLEAFPTAEGQLPFLFKVLSVNKSLSIQAHPNKVFVLFLCHRWSDPTAYEEELG